MDDRCCPARTGDTICHTDGGGFRAADDSLGAVVWCAVVFMQPSLGGFFVGTSLHHSLYIKEGLYMMLALFCVSVFYCISTIYLLFLAIPCNIKYAKMIAIFGSLAKYCFFAYLILQGIAKNSK